MSPPLLFGYATALISTLCFGSFAVPVKLPSVASLNVHPLAFQTYKTAMCAATAWTSLVLPVYTDGRDGEREGWRRTELQYTPWGIVSGVFWVPGGVMAIYAVQNAGLAVAQGTWSSLIVAVSFAWGMAVFGERVKNVYLAGVGVLCLVGGLVGMSVFSEGEGGGQSPERDEKAEGGINDKSVLLTPDPHFLAGGSDRSVVDSGMASASSAPTSGAAGGTTSRAKGLAAAVFNGLWGGSIMVPMHYAPDDAKGMGYVVSFAVGAALVTSVLWLCLWAWGGRRSLPAMHTRDMLGPGCLAGALWSVGNIASMLTVQVLGEAVGYSICQASLLVSGLWGIFYFKEVTGIRKRALWVASAVVTMGGIVLLTAEH
eukprot:CAMPEP_0182468844 /NCGR_PEP_ID=MMETSP1319-20130603/16133_1 /TAXON_ID=172717 /ORGANISM="Bolidomonas pacifica, Strain RCC208" /LENGTH=370 /DNA_ID=CAMNT_0024669091 /DNA_START=99 /DNA_END=1208 /DNA_ORIENTATION=-